MELDAKEVIFLYRRGEGLAVAALRAMVLTGDRHRVAVDEVKIRPVFNAAKQTIARFAYTGSSPYAAAAAGGRSFL